MSRVVMDQDPTLVPGHVKAPCETLGQSANKRWDGSLDEDAMDFGEAASNTDPTKALEPHHFRNDGEKKHLLDRENIPSPCPSTGNCPGQFGTLISWNRDIPRVCQRFI